MFTAPPSACQCCCYMVLPSTKDATGPLPIATGHGIVFPELSCLLQLEKYGILLNSLLIYCFLRAVIFYIIRLQYRLLCASSDACRGWGLASFRRGRYATSVDSLRQARSRTQIMPDCPRALAKISKPLGELFNLKQDFNLTSRTPLYAQD